MTWSKRRSQNLPSLLTGPTFFQTLWRETPKLQPGAVEYIHSRGLLPILTVYPSRIRLLLFSKLACYVCKSVWACLSNPLPPRPRTWKPAPSSWSPVTAMTDVAGETPFIFPLLTHLLFLILSLWQIMHTKKDPTDYFLSQLLINWFLSGIKTVF